LATRLGASPTEIARIVCGYATYLLANSAATLADYPCAEKGGYVYNSIDAHAFDLPNIVDPARIKVGLVSSNVAKKGVLDFLELARRAETILPTLEFHLVGPENNLGSEWQVVAQRPPSNLRLRGYVAHPPDAYRDLNIVVNLSRFAESFGRTVAEAMAARRPVVAYRHGALPELIDDGKTGFLVPYLDLSAVLERLRFFAERPQNIIRFGETARAIVAARCSTDLFARTINALYERLMLRPKS
jgi:glycosyltransferase involved in cell wall biosynthesis